MGKAGAPFHGVHGVTLMVPTEWLRLSYKIISFHSVSLDVPSVYSAVKRNSASILRVFIFYTYKERQWVRTLPEPTVFSPLDTMVKAFSDALDIFKQTIEAVACHFIAALPNKIKAHLQFSMCES